MITLNDYLQMGKVLFGDDMKKWRFVCPGCGHVASVQDYMDAGAPEGAVGFSCIGRYLENCRPWLGKDGPGPCDYTTGGLLNISPVQIEHEGKIHYRFAFAESGADGEDGRE